MSHFVKSWGSEPVGDGSWRFSIWAPRNKTMNLWLDGETFGMDRAARGWFQTERPARTGASYAFALDGGAPLPDPAARAQVSDVHGPSQLVDPSDFEWTTDWKGRPWEETVLYELHVGTYTEDGTFDGVRTRLDHLAELGVTAIELCPIAQFSGNRGWGYDGVLLYAPHMAYGGPEPLKRLVDAAHERGLMVFLDVVYNHVGPDGNYLHAFAPDFFDNKRQTPWGTAIAFHRDPVRRFFIENALFWLDEYRIDGLRLDAIDQIHDPTDEPILEELARSVREHGFTRPVHLTTEDDRNVTFLHERDGNGRTKLYDAEWNDDFHHVAHVLATGERDGYYGDYSDDIRADMLTALSEGYVHQGRPSKYHGGKRRGVPSSHLPPTAFIQFLQNHDQTGNRALGERLPDLAERQAIEVLTVLLLLSPMIPMLFMGEEWAETQPFFFFCDFNKQLGLAVRKGRIRDFSRWAKYADPAVRKRIPHPNDPETFERSKLDWQARERPEGQERMALIRDLLALRTKEIVPRLAGMRAMNATPAVHGARGVEAAWNLDDGSRLSVLANLGGTPFEAEVRGREIFRHGDHRTDGWAIRVALEGPMQ